MKPNTKSLALMHSQGGSFARIMAEAYFTADDINREKLLGAFGDLFERYIKLVDVVPDMSITATRRIG